MVSESGSRVTEVAGGGLGSGPWRSGSQAHFVMSPPSPSRKLSQAATHQMQFPGVLPCLSSPLSLPAATFSITSHLFPCPLTDHFCFLSFPDAAFTRKLLLPLWRRPWWGKGKEGPVSSSSSCSQGLQHRLTEQVLKSFREFPIARVHCTWAFTLASV